MFYAARIGGLLMGPRASFLTLLLLLLSPHYFGHCMNNPKDVPFATGYVASLYYLLRIDGRYPFMTPALSAKIALAIASAIGIRFGGLLLIGYLWLLIAVLTLASGRWRPADVLAVIARTGLVSVAALLLGALFCPWALQQPFVRPFQALRALSHFPAGHIRVLLISTTWGTPRSRRSSGCSRKVPPQGSRSAFRGRNGMRSPERCRTTSANTIASYSWDGTTRRRRISTSRFSEAIHPLNKSRSARGGSCMPYRRMERRSV
jgi:hypothetical protein